MRARYDVTAVWNDASEEQRAAIGALALELRCQLPLSIAIGGDTSPWMQQHDYQLWMAVSQGSTRAQEWRARVRSATGVRAKTVVAGRALLPNPDSLAARLGRRPTNTELAVEFVARLRRGIRDSMDARRR